jgi:hypothetical protein
MDCPWATINAGIYVEKLGVLQWKQSFYERARIWH